MFKYLVFAALLVFASAKPQYLEYPVATAYAGYSAPLTAAYTSPLAYSAYSSAYAPYYSPYAYAAAPYSTYYFR